MAQRIVTSTTPLAASGAANNADTFQDLLYPGLGDTLVGSVFTDKAGTLHIEQSGDGTNYDIDDQITVTANTGAKINLPVILPNVRIRLVNTTGSAQTVLRLFVRVTSAGPR